MDRLWLPIVVGYLLVAAAPLVVQRLPRLGPYLLALYPASSFVGYLTLLPAALGPSVPTWRVRWIETLDLDLALRLDGLSVVFALLVMGIGTAVFVYAAAYQHRRARSGRLFATLSGFAASMLGLVLADDLVVLFVFWELTGLSSYLLIGFDGTGAARRAANQALVLTTGGGLALFVGVLLVWLVSGTTDITALVGDPSDVQRATAYPVIAFLVAAGAFVKSAQVPLHFWLPGAMTAPTPVSAFLHSATLVKAGVYLLARTSPILGGTLLWTLLLTVAGTTTMLLGAWFALRERDLKRVLAFSTVSTLGMLVLLLGVGSDVALQAFVVMVVAHALYKAALFMVAGAVERGTGTRDLRLLGGLARHMPLTAAAAVIGALSLAGLPGSFNFLAKEMFFESLMGAPLASLFVVTAGIVTAALLAAVALTVGLAPFVGRPTDAAALANEPPAGLVVPPLLLGLAGLLFGLLPGLLATPLVASATQAIGPAAATAPLRLWHGFTPALAASVVSLAGGVGLFLVWPVVQARLGAPRPTGSGLYGRAYQGLQRLARVFTRRVQVGQLTVYLGVTSAAAALAVLPLLFEGSLLRTPQRLDLTLYELGIALLLLGSSVFVAVARAPLGAVVGLGLVGYTVAVVFVLFGAPDLAMTQFIFETLFALLFLLVVPRLPTFRKARPATGGTILRVVLPIAFGIAMAAFTYAAVQLPSDAAAARYFADNALPLGKGGNIVNVVLVDFRAIDTLGEVTVLAAAGFGIHALLTASGSGIPLAAEGKTGTHLHPERPIMLRTVTAFLIALLVVYSLFLLLRGHNRPGGGFVGGLVAGAAVGLHALAHDAEETRRLVRFKPENLITFGLGAVLTSGLVGMLRGRAFLTSVWVPGALPVLDGLKLGTPLVFDIGVYAIVLGVSALALIHLREEG